MKNKGCNLILRFSIVAEKMEEREFYELISKFPDTYDRISCPKECDKEKSITYVKTFKNIFDIEVCNNYFIESWSTHKHNIDKLKSQFDFDLVLDYELTIYNFNYPSLYFYPNFNSLISDLGVIFSMYFYND